MSTKQKFDNLYRRCESKAGRCMENEEVELIQNIQSGDKMAFARLMEQYGERVMSVAFRLSLIHI